MEVVENSNSAFVKNIELQSNNEELSEEMKSQSCEAENGHGHQERQTDTQVACFHQRLHEMNAGDSHNFDSWSALIEEVERFCPDNLNIISQSYDSFLLRFPLCHWYWRKYADHIIRLADAHMAVKVFERAVGSIPSSVGLWIDYCHFGMSFYEEPFDVRRLFKRALMFVRRDYLCHSLWNDYIQFEFTQQSWGFLANSYLQVLRFPTEYLHKYYENFKQFVGGMEEELRRHNDCRIEVKALPNGDVKWSEYEISQVIKDLQYPPSEDILAKAFRTYQSIGEEFYQKANELNGKIENYETKIQRRYFDTSPLDEEQLQNWHQYLDFIEKQEDFDWALQVYERCLIPCANYPEFWMRCVEFMESKGGREFANSALERATRVFLQNVPEIHVFSARFKEQIGDSTAASGACVQCDMVSGSYLPTHIIELANIQRRLGKLEEASATLDKAINVAEKMQKLHNYSSLFIHSCRLKYLITGSADTARDILIDGIQRIPLCCELLEELIKFAMTHEGSKQVNLLDSIIAQAISPSLTIHGSQCLALKDRLRISSLFLEFVDLCGSAHDVRKAWIRHVQLFPQLVRKNVVDEQLGSGNCYSDEILEHGERGSCAFRNLQSEGQNSDQPVEEQGYIVPVNLAGKVELACADLNSQKCLDNMECEKDQISANPTTLAASEVNELMNDQVLHQVDDTPGEVESNKSLPQEPKGDVPEPMETTPTMVHVSSEDFWESKDKTCNLHDHSTVVAVSESPQKHSISFDNQDQELEQHPVPISLHSKERASASSAIIVVASDQLDTALDVSKSNASRPQVCLNSDIIPPATDSVQVQESSGGIESASLSSSAIQSKKKAINTHSDSQVTPYNTGEYHAMRSDTITETSGVHFPAKLQRQHQQYSTSKHDIVSRVSNLPISQAYPPCSSIQEQVSQVQNREAAGQENEAINHFRPVNNVSPSSAHQSCTSAPQTSYTQPNLQLHGLQSQTLSPAWQYPQHQLPQLYQQQVVQMLPQQQYQQSYQQLQQFQLQQQHNQQQVSSWQQQEQHQSVQYQVQQLPHQQQSPQQMQQYYHQLTHQLQLHQGQQQQLLPVHEQQQQLYHQSEKLDHGMNKLGYQQNAAQAYQTSLEHYQLHQQAYGQMLPQHQQHQYQYNLVQQQHQLRTSNQDLPKGSSQQFQGRQSTPEASDSTQLRHLSPQSMVRPITDGQSQPAVSLVKQQASSRTSPSYDMDTPESAASSHQGQ